MQKLMMIFGLLVIINTTVSYPVDTSIHRSYFGLYGGGAHQLDYNTIYGKLGYTYHIHHCTHDNIHRFKLGYHKNDAYSTYSFTYGHNLHKPSFGLIMTYMYFAVSGNYFTFETDQQEIGVSPELGLSFMINRRANPFIAIDIGYAYTIPTWEYSQKQFNPHQIFATIGIGLVSR